MSTEHFAKICDRLRIAADETKEGDKSDAVNRVPTERVVGENYCINA